MALIIVLISPCVSLSQDKTPADQAAAEKPLSSAPSTDIAEIVPLAAKLSGRLAALQKKLESGMDIAAADVQFDKIDSRLQELTSKQGLLEASTDYKYNRLVEFKAQIMQAIALHDAISIPIKEAIRQFELARKEWLGEQIWWNELQATVQKEDDLVSLEPTFKKANQTIDTALHLLLSRLEAMLTLQERAGVIEERIGALNRDAETMLEEERRTTLLDESPPILSARFIAQLKSDNLWRSVLEGIGQMSWPDRHFFQVQGWIVLLQAFVSLIVIISIITKKALLNESVHWRFMAARPISAGLFLGYMATILVYEYLGGMPEAWEFFILTIGAVSFGRLVGGLIDVSWKSRFVYGLMVLLIFTQLMNTINLPIALFRLNTVLLALAGLLFFWHLTRDSIQHSEGATYKWLLGAGMLFFAIIIVAELWGKKALATFLLLSMIDSLATVLVFALVMYMCRGALEWLFQNVPLLRAANIDSEETATIIARLARFINIVIIGLILAPVLLMIWGVYGSLSDATKGVLSIGFNLGSLRIDLGLLLTALTILYGSFLASWMVQRLLLNEQLFEHRLERGVRMSIARLVHYAIIIAGFLVALSTLGFEISKITIMLSALGVGIGFGLQGIVNNFVSGLILLFERPVRVGDVVQMAGEWAEIQKIGIRATTVQTFDRADRIIPNADLISNEVTNWTLTNRQIRLIIPVGVAYGSDVQLVTQTLLECAQTCPHVAPRPAAKVLFLNFGESTLDFELRVFATDFNHRIEAKSALHYQIERSFRAANIEIAFPQRDLHLRSVDEAVSLPVFKSADAASETA